MTSLMNGLSLCLLVLCTLVTRSQGDFVEPPPNHSMLCVAEEETTLPCRYQSDPGDTVVQVTWYKEKPDGKKEQIIAAHHTDGQTAFGSYSNRVRFRSNEPTSDSSLVILNTEVSNEGKYTCHISVFPTGNFERQLSLTVRTVPIANLDPVVLTEGQEFRVAATCRAMARPPPRLSWDTELNGKATNRTSEGGAVSSQFSLHPLRSMNGKRLDCLVWHDTHGAPRRLSNKLVVHYPPDADVQGFSSKWYVGLEHAALRCVSRGNPTPQSFTWTREGKDLPEGVIPHPNGTLEFGRSLSLSDAGIYKCEAKNEVGVGKAETEVTVAELPPPPNKQENIMDSLMIIIIAAAAGGLLLVMLIIVIAVTCHHKRKNKKLEKELTEKREEISTLSRQTSFRRINSVSTNPGVNEEHIPLRVEGTLRTSLSSLGEQARCRDSRSTISCGRGGGGGGGGPMLDYLGRPVIHNGSRRGRDRHMEREEESRLRVESYVRNSTMSLQENRLHPPLMPTPFPVVHSTELLRPMNSSPLVPMEGNVLQHSVINRNQQSSPLSSSYPHVTDDDEDDDEEDEGLGGLTSPASQGRPDDQNSDTNSQVSDALSSRFGPPNGTLRHKPRPSPIAVSPHASLIHKAQIV